LQFRLDGNNTNVSLNGTNFAGGPTRVYSADNLADGDHQLFVYVNSLQQNGTVAVDYFEVENSSGQGFGLLWAGPNATSVPNEAIIVDNSSPDVVFSNPSQWGSADNVQYYRRSLSFTTQAGASLSYSFEGVAIWYYSDVDTSHGFSTVSIDGSESEQLNGKNNGGQLTQQMLWSRTNLTSGRHTFTLRQDDVGGTFVSLDFFRILRGDNSSVSVLPSSTATTTTMDTVAPRSNIVPLAIGLTFGLLTLAMVILGAFCLQRRRRRKPVDLLDAYAAPVYGILPTEKHQRSGRPQESNRPPQPIQSPTLASNLSPGVSMVDAISTSPGITESGMEMPPSYESHLRPGRVVPAK